MHKIIDEHKIDVVVTWVDGNDPEWQKERDLFVSKKERENPSSGGDERFVNDGLFKYVFRSIEKNIPWVNNVYLITWGHLPEWLNLEADGLKIVNHSDFLPKEYLPTFNGNVLALNLHRIHGLEERFIYVNDDMYFISPVKKEAFFKKGLPCDMAVQKINEAKFYHDMYYFNVHNDLCLFNKLFKKKDVIKHNFTKWYSVRYGLKNLFKNACLQPFKLFSGIYEPHTPAPYLKTTYDIVWNQLSIELDEASKQKFRNSYDCTENIFRYYNMARGEFYPINRDKMGRYFVMSDPKLVPSLKQKKYKMICINDYDKDAFESVKCAFEKLFPDKSKYEK